MRAVVQRVGSARVEVDGRVTGRIGPGLVVLVAVRQGDTAREVRWLADKVVNLRLFSDPDGKMNLSARDLHREILVVSQFTLYGDCRRGRRPSYSEAASPEVAVALYEDFVRKLEASGLRIQQGVFQAHMDVHLVNDGPVTVLVDSPDPMGEADSVA